jgi:hypothetical protein
MRLRAFFYVVAGIYVSITGIVGAQAQTVRDALQNTRIIVYPENSRPVNRTVAEELKEIVSANARVIAGSSQIISGGEGILRIAIADDDFANGPQKYGANPPKDKDWMFFRLTPAGDGELVTSKPHLLYALLCRVMEDWLSENITDFEKGKLLTMTFKWLEGGDGFFVGRNRFSKNYDPEASIRELARSGCSHVTVNSLATPFPFEQGPPGEIYYRFYSSSPDLDQFVETELNKGTYPPEYLLANLNMLKQNAELALKYGLTPGLNICAPRSVPESLINKYPFLTGARVDHTFRSYRPRYTLTLSHPVVRWHYAQLMKKLMQEVPELGFAYIWTNDSGSGFEYTTTLYPGRNGGAYLIREWRKEEAFARFAGENVLRYYRLLRDAASETKPGFRIISGMFSFPVEGDVIMAGLANRLDLIVSPSDAKDKKGWEEKTALRQRGSELISGARLGGNYLLGVPLPWLAYERLQSLTSVGLDRAIASIDPVSLAPYDISREVLRAFQTDKSAKIDDIITGAAQKMVGEKYAANLVEAWRLTDQAVRLFPDIPLYGNAWAFPWYKLWSRPIVPNIQKVPQKERDYYEKHMIATFNNPTMVDLRKDALWDLIPPDLAVKIVKRCDEQVWQPLAEATENAEQTISKLSEGDRAYPVFVDLRDRLRGLRCYYRTLRNTAEWIVGVHGYLDADSKADKNAKLIQVRAMVGDEIQNTKELRELFQTTEVNFMPISGFGESWHSYGEDFDEVLQKKIALMEAHKDDVPHIDPNFMWRMPEWFPVAAEEYLKY